VQLERARSFVDAARLVCDAAKAAGAHQCAIVLHRHGGPIVLSVDNSLALSDDDRRYVLTRHYWVENPVLVSLRETSRSICRCGPDGDVFAIPIFGARGWCASVGFVMPRGYPMLVERELGMLATHLSVWCVQHGIDAVPDEEVLGERQHRIAELAARGHTNAEIAEALGISINTVKSRLKEVFERLNVHNRTELAHVLRRLAPLQGIPTGITRYKSVTVTRAARQPSGSMTTKP
jgi:DNA-binding CsgD family transcriptional regulator